MKEVSNIKNNNIKIELKAEKKEENEQNVENIENKKNEENNENKEEIKQNEEKEIKEENNENENNKENNENIDIEPINKNLNSDRKVTNEEVKECSTLILESKETDIFNGQTININASGMIGGREVGDGITIFGCNSSNEGEDGVNSLKSDFILNLKEKYSYPYIFIIYFNKETKSYFIRPYSSKNNDNRIIYVKLTNGYNISLKQKEIISAGNIIFQVSPIENNNLEIVNLSKQNLSISPKQTFDASSKKEVTIGRNKDCDFAFPNNKSFSRIQTTFEYDEENQEWIIIDGSRTKSSTNGTWVFCTHSFPIKNKMDVEILNNRIQITEELKEK